LYAENAVNSISAADETHSTPLDPLAGFRGVALQQRGGKRRVVRYRRGKRGKKDKK